MLEREIIKTDNPITVDIATVQAMFGVGKATAMRIGKESGALIKLGRRSVYSVAKLKKYIEEKGA